MSTNIGCLFGSDNQLGPRISIDCRSFDFTLLFEDACFSVLPAAVFLLLVPLRLHFLRGVTVKSACYRLAVGKLSLLAVLFVLHVLYVAFSIRTLSLYTSISMTSGILNIIAVFSAAILSLIENQRSIKPSDLLVIYFSASSVLALPRLRTLWLIPSTNPCRVLWTIIEIFNVVLVFVESARKTGFLHLQYLRVTKEQLCGFWGRSFFIWVLPFFQAGYSSILEIEKMPEVDEDLQGESADSKLQSAWNTARSHHRLLRATFYAYRWAFASGIFPRLARFGFTFCQPFLITATVGFMGRPTTDESKHFGQALVGAFVLVYLGMACIGDKRIVLILCTDLKDSAAITLMSTDVERIVSSFRSIHETWASVLEVSVAIWLLERQVFAACIVPVAICLGSVLAMVPVSTRTGEAQKQWIERVQTRLAVTSSMLGDMKGVKLLGLTDILVTVIKKLRRVELKTSKRFRKLLIWQIALSNMPTDFAPFATFAVYSIVSATSGAWSPLSAQVFGSLALIALLTGPLIIFCQAMPALLQAVSCFGRIEEYCLKKPLNLEASPVSEISLVSPSDDNIQLQYQPTRILSGHPLVSFSNANISWSPEGVSVLHNINIDVQTGITMIVGPVGSGKSALIESLLGETNMISGSITAPLSRVAYCSQNPWIMNSTVENNITGGAAFDQKWFDFTISACGLEEDLKNFPGGHMYKSGSNGISLSGGQKQRVALARAVYSRFQVLILDDVFSGLDSKSISLISASLFGEEGYFRKTGISVILATHTQSMLSYADNIIILDDGTITDQGSYEEIIKRVPELAAKSLTTIETQGISPLSVGMVVDDLLQQATKPGDAVVEIMGNTLDHVRQEGSWSVYLYYIRRAGYIPVVLFAFSTLLEAISTNFATLWLQWWVEANENQPDQKLGMYLGIYFLICSLSLLSIIGSCWLLFILIINNTALGMHFDLLKATLGAPFSFFQMTDTGSITNRFSQDMQLIDMMLPLYAINFSTGACSCVVKLIILCIVGKYLAASVPFLAVILFSVQLYYLRTSRQVRLLDIESMAPLFTHFLETAKGVSTIRAFHWESQFIEQSQSMLNRSQKPFYMQFCIQQWLQLVLDLVVGAITLILVALTTSMKDKFSAGSIGVGLNLILTFNQEITSTIKNWTMLESSIGAVSRIEQFIKDTPSEEGSANARNIPPQDWPSQGAISFKDVTVGYHPDSAPILKNISLAIKSGEKVAVCGTSGSGKTSLILSLLQMIDIQSGLISIDGVDLSTISKRESRLRVNVIPQDPFFMPGTVRFNLDSYGCVADEKLETAIKRVGLWKRIGMNGGLDMELSPSDWSVGERQLLALARALAMKSKILILDEATSSVDAETESIMQQVIENEFLEQTVIAVVHRFRYIQRFDRVVVLKNGNMIECDSATSLLDWDSEFRKLYTALDKLN